MTRKPFCLVSLGGISLNPGIPAPEAAQWTRTTGPASSAFYQAHWYVNPMLYWLEVLLDFACLEHGGFDLAYLTEVDPLWKDDELTVIINPDAILFANPLAIAACAADCVAASVGFGLAPAVLVCRLPGRPLPDGRVPADPYRRGAKLDAHHPASHLENAPAADRLGVITAPRRCADRTSSR